MQHFTFKTTSILRGGLSFVFSFLLAFTALAQQPMSVTGSLQINSPYPANWSEYAATGANRMGLTLTLNDAETGATNARLKLFIERNNTLIAMSSDVVTGVPTLNLVPFITRQLGALDLNPYFRIENLQGLSTPQYQRVLEDGVYRISFQVVDAVTGRKLSDPIGQSIFITLNDPPQLTQPSQGEQIVSSGGNITFQWLPRATTALPLQYEWTLIEVPVGATNLEGLWTTAPILYRATVTTNTLPRPATNFTTGKTYAWRVQAKTQSSISVFNNNGYSETFAFQIGSLCPPVSGLRLEAKASDVIAVSWTGSTLYYNYRVAYRKYSTSIVWEWVEQPTTNTFLNLAGLEASTEYEIKVGGVCASGATSFSAPLRATTLALGQIQGLNCGQMPPLPTAGTPIASLVVGDVIMSGDFPVTLTKVSGGNGNFSGEGWVKIPWMGSTKIKVLFTGIGVNTEKKLTSGFLQTAYDPNWGNILNVDGIFEGGTNVGIIRSGRDTAEFYTNFAINGTGNITYNSSSGTITVTGSGGQTQTFTANSLPTTIKDNLGQIYGVDATGKAILIGRTVPMPMTSTELNTLSSDKGSAIFTQPVAPQNPLYAFDAYQEAYDKDVLWREKYEKIGTYGVGRKAGAPGKPDIINVKVVLTDATLKADSVRFITAKGMQYTSRSLGAGLYEVNVVGGLAGDGQELYALHPKADGKYFSLGKVAVFSYKPQKRKLALVPVNGAIVNQSAIAQSLKDIYDPICVQWEVSLKDNYTDMTWDINGDTKMQIDETGFWSTQTLEMKKLKNNYAKSKGVDEKTIYLFFINEANKVSVAGDMPRGKQFGFIFLNGNTQVNKTIAHEVGHGVLQLKHTFDTRYHFGQGDLVNNLMNYGQGISLSKYQWDAIHDPGIVIGSFDKDEDVQNYNIERIDTKFLNYRTENDPIKYFSFLSPNGKIVSIPSNGSNDLIKANFAYGSLITTNSASNTLYLGNEELFTPDFRAGTLDFFVIKKGNEELTYAYNHTSKSYKLDGTGTEYVDDAPDPVIKGFIFPASCGNKYSLYKFPRTDIPHYSSGGNTIYYINIANLGFFSDGRKAMKDAQNVVLRQDTETPLYRKSIYNRTVITSQMTMPYCETPQLIDVDRIAQIRNVYPEYFATYTQTDGNWLNPQFSTEIPPISDVNPRPTRGPWAANLWTWGDKIGTIYKDSSISNYPRLFLYDLMRHINDQITNDIQFWDQLTINTSADLIRDFLKRTPVLKIQEAPLDKKEIAFKILLEKGYYCEKEVLKLLNSFLLLESAGRKHFLNYVTQNITIKSLDEKYKGWFPEDQYSLAMLAFSSLIEDDNIHNEAYQKLRIETNVEGGITKNSELITLDADLIKNRNTRYTSVINSDNTITFTDKVNNTVFLTNVPFDAYIPVEFLTPLSMLENQTGSSTVRAKYTTGSTPSLPAIYVAALLQQQSASLFSKKAWLTFDVGTMFLGIGEFNAAIKSASWLRKGIAMADIAASSVNITSQLISDNTLSPEAKKKIQFISAVFQAPAAVRGIAELFSSTNKIAEDIRILSLSDAVPLPKRNLLNDLYNLIKGGAKTASEAKDAANFKNAAVFLEGVEAERVMAALGKIQNTDNTYYIAIHAHPDGTFSVLYKGINVNIQPSSVARWISENVPTNFKNIVLLSCNDAASTQKMVDALVDIETPLGRIPRTITTWEGEVSVFENGYIKGEGRCKKFNKSTNGQENSADVTSSAPKGTGEAPILSGTNKTASVTLSFIETFYESIPRLKNAGLTIDDLKRLKKFVIDYRDIKKLVGNSKLTDWLSEIEKMTNLPKDELERVVKGLQSTSTNFIKGELFRLKACENIGWTNVKNLEMGTGGNVFPGSTFLNRYIDIVRKGDNFRIECKNWYNIPVQGTSDINKYIKQIKFDLQNSTLNFEHWFCKSDGIISQTELANQVKAILNSSDYDELFVGTQRFWQEYVGNNKQFSSLDHFISQCFKLKDF